MQDYDVIKCVFSEKKKKIEDGVRLGEYIYSCNSIGIYG